jgi:hypothetical protein
MDSEGRTLTHQPLTDNNWQLGPQQQQQYNLKTQQQEMLRQAHRQHIANQDAAASKEQKLPEALLPGGASHFEKQDPAPTDLLMPRLKMDSEDLTTPGRGAAEEPAPKSQAESDFEEEDLDGNSSFTAADDTTGGTSALQERAGGMAREPWGEGATGVIGIINDSDDEPSEPPSPVPQRSEPRARPAEPPPTGAATQDARQDKLNLKPCAQCKKNRKGVNHCISNGHAALKAESVEEEEAAELAEKIAAPDTLRIKFTVGDSFPPGTLVVVTPGEVLADAQDVEFQVGK